MERICGGSERIEEALVFLRIGSTPRTFLRTRSTVRALVPARCSTGPPRTVSPPARGVCHVLRAEPGLSHAHVEVLNNAQPEVSRRELRPRAASECWRTALQPSAIRRRASSGLDIREWWHAMGPYPLARGCCT